ncbi:hypothetical protein CR513_26141, partial [Mucuna pruriens]
MLNGKNFKVWKEAIEIVLRSMDLDLALRVEELIPTIDNLQERFGALFLRVKGIENIREYIMEMSNLAAKLKPLKLELGEDLIVHLILISLHTHFGYNTQKDKWSLSEFISHYVQEEERLQRDKTESAHFTSIKIRKGRTLRVLWKGLLNERKLGVERAKDVLELIHTDICSPFPTASWNGQQYFITFIDDYSSSNPEMFSSLSKPKLNFNLERKLKPSNLICGIVLQCTMPSKPSMNGVTE